MFIDIWDKENKAIKINKFDKDLLNIEERNNAVNKLVADYGIVLEGANVKTDYYQIYFDSLYFRSTLNFLTLFDCFTFLVSDTFSYLYESENIKFIQITANKRVMFEYDNR